jgi:hypothetical protein
MKTAPAIEFPVIGVSCPQNKRRYAFVAHSEIEMRECPLHLVWRGMLHGLYFIDRRGQRFDSTKPKVAHLDVNRIREVGIFVSVFSAILSGLNIPVILSFELIERAKLDTEELRATLRQCLNDYPSYYTLNNTEREVEERLRRAKNVEEFAAALSS